MLATTLRFSCNVPVPEDLHGDRIEPAVLQLLGAERSDVRLDASRADSDKNKGHHKIPLSPRLYETEVCNKH